MHIIFFMIGVSLLIALGFLAAFVWSMRTGQQDDLYTPALRMLLDDEPPNDPIPAKPQRLPGATATQRTSPGDTNV
ncbi:cbb3-type cytochrome oxidase assembly protein CcoS [Spirosoma arcticum]